MWNATLVLAAACLVSGGLVSAVVTWIVLKLAPRFGLLDRPNARKVHVTPTPLGGGLGIIAGVVIPLAAAHIFALVLASMPQPPAWIPAELARHVPGAVTRGSLLWTILCAGLLLAALGLIDDLKNLRWQPKLAVQCAVACGLVAGGVQASVFLVAPWMGSCLTVVWILVLTNAFNFLDNMDGLTGGVAGIASVLFAIIMLTGSSHPHWFVAGFLLVLAGAIGGFLLFNWPPARIFMGDTGSLVIGMWLASLTVTGTFYDYQSAARHVMLAPLCVLAVPLYDFCSVVWIRLREGRSPFHADKSHFSHRLVELGMSRKQAVLTIHLLTLATGLAGLLMYQVPTWTGAWLALGGVVCMLWIIALLESAARRKARRERAAAEG